MKFLLDTHAMLWWLKGDRRLGPQAREAISDRANDVVVSIVSLWEVVVKARTGELRADVGQLRDGLLADGFTLLGVTLPHLQALAAMPTHHRDPFYHLLIAQAVVEGATFVSDDGQIGQYAVPLLGCRA